MKHAPSKAALRRRQLKGDKKRVHRQEQMKRRRVAKVQSGRLVYQLHQTISHFFPDLLERIGALTDCRRKSMYELSEIIMAGIALFLFKEGSRNAFNNQREEKRFAKNYRRLFKGRLPHLDTVHRVFEQLAERELETLKRSLIKSLLEKKVWHSQRLFKRWFLVAIDGSGVFNFDQQHCPQCLHQTSKKGKTRYFHNVLEAKLITPKGFSISLATEWIENPDSEYDKQDCERKAFRRLAATLKRDYPRLPMCLVADGLYPNQGFFEICRENDWTFILTFKDGNLPSVWEEVHALQALREAPQCEQRCQQGKIHLHQRYRWLTDIDYHATQLNWIECQETETTEKESTTTRFVHLTNIKTDATTVVALSRAGRLRWKIENEGFNCQKNQGYALEHK
ncbi:MAG: hypothetical protein GY927_24285 [bacterium]|nr:hypothetical protein [bacterium]